MREMHKWKDKVELSLDNRQIFFLFFGLSVIGCFVFALGIMTGRRIDWDPGQQAAAVGGHDSLAMLDAEPDESEHFAFQQGLVESDAAEIPATRDPEIPPRDEDEVKAERAEQAERDAAVEQREAQAAEVEAKLAAQQQALARTSPAAAQQKPAAAPAQKPAAQPEPGNEPDAQSAAQSAAPAGADGRRFTLQMKAFSEQSDAEKLADKLRHNGHEVRIESHDVRGRTWHRVRLGAFDNWDDALAAKQAFESSEHIIAYVVSL